MTAVGRFWGSPNGEVVGSDRVEIRAVAEGRGGEVRHGGGSNVGGGLATRWRLLLAGTGLGVGICLVEWLAWLALGGSDGMDRVGLLRCWSETGWGSGWGWGVVWTAGSAPGQASCAGAGSCAAGLVARLILSLTNVAKDFNMKSGEPGLGLELEATVVGDCVTGADAKPRRGGVGKWLLPAGAEDWAGG